jgi:DNA polymerase-3 subunit delta'
VNALWGPWLDLPLEQARTAGRAGRLGHAFLVQGPPGWGQQVLAAALAREWLGELSVAADVHLSQVAHPDLRWVLPEGKGEQIRIDAVRELAEFVAQTPHVAACKVAVLDPADALNEQAANALLKTLEEPAGSTRLLLVSEAPTALLPTLRSRCQRLTVRPVDRTLVLAWLRGRVAATVLPNLPALAAEYGHAPFAVLAAIERGEAPLAPAIRDVLKGRASPIAVAQRLAGDRLDATVARSMRLVATTLADRVGVQTRSSDDAPKLVDVPPAARDLVALWEEHLEAHRLCLSTGNPNPQLLLERLLFGWRRLGIPGGV